MPAPRRILIDPQIYDCLNMGGVAMAQGLVARLRARWPDAELCVLTESPEALATVLPGTVPVPHGHFRRWTGDRFLLGPLFRVMPERVARQVIDAQRGVELRYPVAMGAARQARMYFAPAEGPAYRSFLATLRGADLVIISGSSGPSEAFPATLRATLALLDLARTHGVPSAMVSQGASEVTMPSITTRLRETLALLRGEIERAQVRVLMAGDRSTPLILGDPAQLKQLLLNVLMNALEAIDHGGEVAIRMSHSLPSHQVLVEISDTGPGVPTELLSKMFETFVTTKPEGSGLGLAICRAIADAHHAVIRAENNPGRPGMTIILEFPLPEVMSTEPAASDLQTLLWNAPGATDSARSQTTR